MLSPFIAIQPLLFLVDLLDLVALILSKQAIVSAVSSNLNIIDDLAKAPLSGTDVFLLGID